MHCDAEEELIHEMKNDSDCRLQCDSFIYTVLDWSQDPVTALFYCVGGSFACILIHLIFYGLHKASFDIKGIKKNYEFFFLIDKLSIVALVDIIKSYNLLDPLGPLKVGKKLIFFF